MPPRHGKSLLTSRIFPVWAMGRTPGLEVVCSSYSAELAADNSRAARMLARSGECAEIFPALQSGADQRDLDQVGKWQAGESTYTAVGVGGSLTGRGADIAIIDDPFKDWESACSPRLRETVWDWYQAVLLTRLSPAGRVVVVATRWHPDDLSGRLIAEGGWHVHHMPAIAEDGAALWPERWDAEKLAQVRASIGLHKFAALYQGAPVLAGGNLLRVENIRRVPLEAFPSARYVRAWDLASSVKQRTGSDPDFTAGILGAVTYAKDPATGASLPQLWIRDAAIFRAEAPERNRRIVTTAEADGQAVGITVEAFGAYKDAAAQLAEIMRGRRSIKTLTLPGDKVAKASPLEPIFEAGNVFVPDGAPWLDQWLVQCQEFPRGSHDDAVDATALVWHSCKTSGAGGLLI